MALTADQTAIVELLLGGQEPAELGGLLGLDEPEVRRRAREALTELGGADPDRHVDLTSYLLGYADPIGRADAVRHLRQDESDRALAERIVEELRRVAPDANLPQVTPTQGEPRLRLPSAPRLRRTAAGEPRERRKLPGGERSSLYVALAGGAVVVVAVVLAVAGVFSGDDGSASETTSADSSEAPGEVAGDEIQRIALEPTGSGDASGEGAVGITRTQAYLDLNLQNLEPAPQGQVYVVWFLFNERTGYPLSPIAPDAQGNFQDRFAVPTPALSILARMRFLNVSLAPVEDVQRAVQKAVEAEDIVIPRPGRTILQNPEPLAAEPAPSGGGQSGG